MLTTCQPTTIETAILMVVITVCLCAGGATIAWAIKWLST